LNNYFLDKLWDNQNIQRNIGIDTNNKTIKNLSKIKNKKT